MAQVTSKAPDLTKRTFYLDHATLATAFGATYGSDAYRAVLKDVQPLTQLVEAIAAQHNLCVSLIHMQELAAWLDPNATEMEKWLEAMPLVWSRSPHHLVADEVTAGVERLLGKSERYAMPWASCFTAILETPTTTPAIMTGAFLGQANVPSIAGALRSRLDDRAGEMAMVSAKKLYDNEQWANDQGWTADDKAAWTRKMRDQGVRAAGIEAARRMGWGHRRPDVKRAVEEVVKAYARAPLATLPGFGVQGACITDFVSKARAKELTSDKHRSTPFDYQHATIGAAYADVFTCDKLTGQSVRASRKALQRSPALVTTHKKDFLRALENAAS